MSSKPAGDEVVPENTSRSVNWKSRTQHRPSADFQRNTTNFNF